MGNEIMLKNEDIDLGVTVQYDFSPPHFLIQMYGDTEC